MFDRIIAFSLKNRLFVLAAASLLLVYGTYVLINLPVDVLPDLNRPTVTIMTEAEGLAPEEVETLVTLPLETAMNGAPGVERVRSVSGIGLSIIYVEFGWNTDIYLNRQLVTERLQTASARLPQGVIPTLGPISSVMGQIMMLGVTSTEHTPMEVRTFADFTIRQRLLTIPGIAQVIAIGGGVKQYQVRLNNSALASYRITINEVEEALSQSTRNTTGGYVEAQGEEFLVRNIASTVSLDDIANTVVKAEPGRPPVLIRHVARVAFGSQIKRGDASLNGRPAVILSVEKQPNANTLELTEKIDAALNDLDHSLPVGMKVNREVFRQSHFINSAISNVEHALRDGFILVTLVLFLFLLNFRTTIITLTAIPLSIVVTAIVFQIFDVTINTMTLGGLAVAIGELVDDAIVDVENVFRRLRENRQLAQPLPVLTVVYRASKEVRNSIVYATVLVVLVFLPLFAMQGMEGRIFAPLGIAYITSILASLFVSLTVTPALASYLLGKSTLKEEKDSRFVTWLKNQDRFALEKNLEDPKPIFIGAALLFAGSLIVLPFLGSEFLPPFNEGSLTINVLAQPGTSLEESNRFGVLIEKQLMQVPEVVTVARRTGRAELDEHAEGTHSSEIDVDLKESDRDREEVIQSIRERMDLFPGIVINIGQPISHRLDHLLSGVRAQIAVKLFGNDLTILRQKAEEVRRTMATVAGAVDVSVEKQTLIPQIPIRIDRSRAAQYGLTPGYIAQNLETLLNGKVVSQVLEGQASYALLVRSDTTPRSTPEMMGDLFIQSPSGVSVPLREIATIEPGRGPNAISHENVQRRIVIQANVSERALGDVVQEMQRTVAANVDLPDGYFVTFGGQFESQQDASRLIGILSIFSLAAMFLVLYTHFKSAAIALQILLNIPLALIGSVIAILLTDRTVSVASLVGFITLTGIASRNGIMMISHYLHLVKEEGATFSKEMIIRGSLERLVPVLMTAITAGLALIPLVLAAGEPGKEILYPVAVVILGGLVSSTLLDIVITPLVFYRYGEKALNKYIAAHDKNASTLTTID
jgi:CzcA family heavy metal efflux pump